MSDIRCFSNIKDVYEFIKILNKKQVSQVVFNKFIEGINFVLGLFMSFSHYVFQYAFRICCCFFLIIIRDGERSVKRVVYIA